MRKIAIALLLAICLAWTPAYAGRVYNKQIMDTDFNAVTTSDTSDTVTVSGYDKIAFYAVYDETQVGNSISATVTLDVSYDGTNWLTGMSFLDIAGTSTYQTSETISVDGWYVCWLTKDPCVPYVRVAVTANNTDADDLLTVVVYAVAKE
jgi:hypothetical protein